MKEIPPTVDLILCRDLFVHLTTQQIFKCIKNIIASDSEYLLLTTFTNNRKYKNLIRLPRIVGWRPINMQLQPFNLPQPDFILNENCTEGSGKFSDKSLALYKVSELRKVNF
jgi:hypothetical protein